MRLNDQGQRRRLMLTLACALTAGALLAPPAKSAQTNTSRPQPTRKASSSSSSATKPTTSAARPTATPIRVPQLPAATAAATPTPTQPQQRPQPTTTPVPTPAPTDDAAIADDDEVVRVTSNLVVVPVAVTDAQSEPVLGLKVGDFALEEEGRVQTLAQVGDAEQVPLDIALLLDVSSSTSERFTFEKQAAAGFLKQVLRSSDRAAVYAISSRPKLEQALATAEQAATKLTAIPASTVATPTAFYDSVISAARYLAQNVPPGRRRVILVISDGQDNFSDSIREGEVAQVRAEAKGEKVPASAKARQQALHQRALAQVQREVQRADAVFYAINPSSEGLRLNVIGTRAQEGMQQLAEQTGGSAFVPERSENFVAVFRQIANELRAQYLLQYYSNGNAQNGAFLKIKVRVPTRTDLRVRARQGYYAKK